VLANRQLSRANRRIDKLLDERLQASVQRARTKIAQYRAAERAPAIQEQEPVTEVIRVEWAQVQGVETLSTTPRLEHHAPRPLLYLVDSDGTRRPYITDDEAELAAIRAQMQDAHDYGPEETWLVKGRIFGESVKKVYVGPLSALRAIWPDLATRKRLEQAGAADLPEMVGVPVLIEKLPRQED
jgi:hypothetical protein